MAFTIRNLENHSGSGAGVKIFSYSTDDAAAVVKAANYFNDASINLSVGDRIHVHASDADFDCHVSAVAAGVVTVAAIDAF